LNDKVQKALSDSKNQGEITDADAVGTVRQFKTKGRNTVIQTMTLW